MVAFTLGCQAYRLQGDHELDSFWTIHFIYVDSVFCFFTNQEHNSEQYIRTAQVDFKKVAQPVDVPFLLPHEILHAVYEAGPLQVGATNLS